MVSLRGRLPPMKPIQTLEEDGNYEMCKMRKGAAERELHEDTVGGVCSDV